jgi:hypothetical protein
MSLTRAQYRRVVSHPLRDVMQKVCTDHRGLPGRHELARMVDKALDGEKGVTDALKDQVFAKAVELAKSIDRNGGDNKQAHVIQLADEYTASVLDKLDADDQLIDPPADEDIDAHAVAEAGRKPINHVDLDAPITPPPPPRIENG